MVSPDENLQIVPVERRMADLLSVGEPITLAAVGGFEEISRASERLGASPLLPELLPALVEYGRALADDERGSYHRVFSALLADVSNEFVLIELIDTLNNLSPLPGTSDEICFSDFLRKAQDRRLSGLARGLAVEGAFRWAAANRRWQLRLMDCLLGIALPDDKEFLRRAAKISGVAHSYWKEDGLVVLLQTLAEDDCCSADASFELGMAALAQGLEAVNRHDAASAFARAQRWFEQSIRRSEVSPEAQLYVDCLHVVTSFYSGAQRDAIAGTLQKISTHAFELRAWCGSPDSLRWLGSRRLEVLYWNQLALALDGLLTHLNEASWWEPAVVVENYLFAVYSAGRTLNLKSGAEGMDELLRPRILASLLNREGQAYALKSWMRRNPQHDWAAEAENLLTDIDRYVEASGSRSNPSDAAVAGTSIVALIDKSYLPIEIKARLTRVVSNAMNVHIDNLTHAEVDVINGVSEAADQFADYRDNPHGGRLFDAILMWLVRFLYNRLEISKGDDATVAYLYSRGDGSPVTEDLLQDDFYRWLTTNIAGSDIEATNVSGGRADVRVRSSNERIVVEVKRELTDSSFASLAASYEAQATDYQNVSVRLGFLLVLDLVKPGTSGTPHLSSLVKAQSVQRVGEASPRLLVIAKVPGNRLRPSDLTRAAKSNSRSRR